MQDRVRGRKWGSLQECLLSCLRSSKEPNKLTGSPRCWSQTDHFIATLEKNGKSCHLQCVGECIHWCGHGCVSTLSTKLPSQPLILAEQTVCKLSILGLEACASTPRRLSGVITNDRDPALHTFKSCICSLTLIQLSSTKADLAIGAAQFLKALYKLALYL